MHKFDKLIEEAEKELKIREEDGLKDSNFNTIAKLVELLKGLYKIDMMQDGDGGYSRDREDYGRDGYSRDDYDRGNSYRRGRNRRTGEYMHRPNYSRLAGDDTDMDRYKEDKKNYSNSRDGRDKDRMLDSLETLVANVCDMVAQVYRDCDCVEERNVIINHVRRLQEKLERQ